MIFCKNDMFEKIIFFEYCVFISNVVILHSQKNATYYSDIISLLILRKKDEN